MTVPGAGRKSPSFNIFAAISIMPGRPSVPSKAVRTSRISLTAISPDLPVEMPQISAGASQFLIIIGIVIGAQGLGGIFLMLGAVALAVICLFQLVTLPVEFDASRRAKQQLSSLGLVSSGEAGGASKVLSAAALTYVAAALVALTQLIYLIASRR